MGKSLLSHVRRGLSSDLDALIDLSRRTIRACYSPFLGHEAVDAFVDTDEADRYVKLNIERCSVIVAEGQVLGYSVCRDNLIDLMMIDHAFHRRGLGSWLLINMEEMLFREHDELRLESFEGNEVANAFYRKHGWLELKRYVAEDSGVPKLIFRKLTPRYTNSSTHPSY
jgi:GNAT superfamily N-acetyltransferase